MRRPVFCPPKPLLPLPPSLPPLWLVCNRALEFVSFYLQRVSSFFVLEYSNYWEPLSPFSSPFCVALSSQCLRGSPGTWHLTLDNEDQAAGLGRALFYSVIQFVHFRSLIRQEWTYWGLSRQGTVFIDDLRHGGRVLINSARWLTSRPKVEWQRS